MPRVKYLLLMVVLFTPMVHAEIDKDEMAKVERLSRVLSLTPHQKTMVTQEREKSFRALKIFERKWQMLHGKLRAEMQKGTPDQKRLEKITAEIGTVQGEIILLRTRSLLFVKSLLSKEQRELLEQGAPDAR